MEKQKLIYVESKALFSPSSVSNKAIVFIKDTKEIWTHGTYFICSNVWATPITLTLSGDSTGSVSIDGSGNVTLSVTNKYLHCTHGVVKDANSALSPIHKIQIFSEFAPSFSNGFPATNYANAIININTHSQNYDHQLGFSSNKGIYHRTRNAGNWDSSWEKLLTSTNYTKYPHTFASLTNKPTTLSGYGITDSIPIIKGGEVTTDTDLSTLGMTTTGYKFSISWGYESYPSWLMAYTNVLMFRGSSDSYGAIGIEMMGDHRVLFMGGRNAETTKNNVPNWWFRIKGNSSATYDLNSFLNIINNLDSNYLRKSGGTMTGILTLTTDTAYINDTQSGSAIFGTVSTSNTFTGISGLETIFAGRLTNMVLRTSGDNLYHYNHSKSARYKILDANNYTAYALPLTGGTLTDTLILKAGAFTASNSNSYSGGRYQAVAKPNIRLIGDSTYGLSTIEFISLKGDTSINKPSDSGFIQFQPYGVSALSSVGSHPTLKTSGESNALVLGVTNDSDDIIVLLSPNISGLRHACGATEYYLPHITTSTTTANKPLVSTTTAHVYTLGDEYLPLKGGTMTGKITLWSSNADAANTGGLNANNSNIYGLNSLYFADASETAAEGINFYRSSTTVDSLWGSNGNLYWTPNRTYGSAGTSYYVLTSNNYSTHLNKTYLPLSGGTMTGKIQMTRGAAYLNDTGTDYSMLGMINSGTSTTGMNSEEGMFINVPFTLATLRTSGNNLWHYNHANSARYLILDANNYTNYTIPYSKVNVTNGALGAFIYNGNLLYNNNFKYLTFFPSDNLAHTSYVLIAKIDNWANTANATSAISYGINGLFITYRGGNMANTGSYFVTNVAFVDTNYKNYKLYFSEARSELLVPLLVIYLGEYYLAFKKDGSSTDYHFYGQVFNILPSFIYVNDTSLITLVSGPSVTATTGLYYYNEGNGFKKFLHEGNYSNYALPLSGGTMTGNITWNTDSHGVYFYGGCGIEKWSGYGPTLIAEINTDFYIRNSTDRADYHKIIHTGNYSSYALPLSGGTMTGALNFKNNTWNKVGDDAYMGDCNVAGMIGIKGSNADTPGFAMYNSGGTLLGLLCARDNNLSWTKGSETVNNIILHTGNYSEYALKINGSNGTADGVSTLLNKLTVESINPQDADYYICQYAGGSTATTTYHRRPTSALYSYIRAKLYNSTSNYFIMGNGDLLSKEDVYSIGSYTAVKNSYYTGNAMYYYWYKIEFPESSSGSASATYSIMINDDNNYPRFSHYILNIKRYYANNIYGNSYQLTHLGGTSLNIMLWIANDSTPNLYILCPCAYGEYGLRIKCIYGTNKFNPTPVEYNNGGVASSFTIINKYLDLCSVRVDNTGVVTHTYGNIIKTDIVGNVTGTATSANKLNTNAGNSTTPVYFSNGIPVACTAYSSAAVNKANLLASLDLRNKYPALIVTAGLNIGASFMTASKLGISGDGSYYDTLIIRGYSDSSGGKENAIMFGKNTSSVYHSQYDFGSTTTWGTLYKFLDSGNYKNYAPSLSGEGATGTWGISISGAANKVANALTLQLNGGTTAGTNKFVYDGASAYTINITPDSIGAAASSHTHSYLPLSGGKLGSATASYTDLYIKSSTAMLRLTSFTDSTTYIQSGNSDFTGNATLKITGYNVNTGSNLYFNFANIYCRGSNYINIDSGNYSSYALPKRGGTLGSSSASSTELRTQCSAATLRLISFSNSINYILSGNSAFNDNAALQITGYNGLTGSDLYFKFNNIYCRENNYINIDSGNYGSYALPLSGGTMTGTINTANIYPKAHAGFNIGSTSSYYNTMYAYYFKKYGSDDNYLLLGGGGHKKISDFPLILDKGIEGGNGGNTDNWVLVLNNNYSTGWYGPCTMFYIRSKNFGCGILCFYHYWNTEGTSGYYDNSVWFFGAEHSAYSVTMGGMGRDINNYLKVYIDKENADLKIYYNRYNNLALNVQELLFVHGPSGTLYPSGELRASHFINSTQAVELPTTSNTFVNIPILTVKNHTEDIKTTRSVYASAFYENSDIRLKENVHSIDLIDLLKNVDLVLFNFKNDLNKKYGVIAQQLEQVGLNNLVYEHNGNKAVDYISLLVLETLRLRNEIKELKEKLDKKELSS